MSKLIKPVWYRRKAVWAGAVAVVTGVGLLMTGDPAGALIAIANGVSAIFGGVTDPVAEPVGMLLGSLGRGSP